MSASRIAKRPYRGARALWRSTQGVTALLRALRESPNIHEVALRLDLQPHRGLRGCRSASDRRAATTAVADISARRSTRSLAATAPRQSPPSLYTYVGGEAVRHLFPRRRRRSTLWWSESRRSWVRSKTLSSRQGRGCLGKFLSARCAARCTSRKRVRTETAIGEGQVSVSSVAVDLARANLRRHVGARRASSRGRRDGRGRRQAPGEDGGQARGRQPQPRAGRRAAQRVRRDRASLGRARPARS